MSADLILTGISIQEGKEPDWSAGEDYIRGLQKVGVRDWPDDYQRNYLDITEEEEPGDEDNYAEDKETHISLLLDSLRDLKEAFKTGGRESVVWKVGNLLLLITGGMSWGDSPTELFNSIGRLGSANVLQRVGFDSY